MKILVDSNIPLGRELFGSHGEVEFFEGRSLSREQLKDSQALIVRSVTKVNEDLLKDSTIQFVGTATIGTDHIDLPYLDKNKIGFAYAPGCNCNAVGDYVISMLLKLHRQKKINLENKTLGIVGFGNVGKNLAPKARAIGLNVLACDPPLEKSHPGKYPLVDYSSLIEKSHFLSFHVPLSKEGPHKTLGLINQNFLEGLRQAELIINTSRGPIIHSESLINWKKQNPKNSLVLDVFPNEPLILPELVDVCDYVSPHIAGYSAEGKIRGSFMIYEEFCHFFNLPPGDMDWPLLEKKLSLNWKPSSKLLQMESLAHEIFDFTSEDFKLRQSLQSQNPGAGFDALRKNFPERRDFSAYKLFADSDSQSLPEELKDLGFKLG